ncbi:MAG: sigma-54-dependent Fis family transcriptional regulator [Byssovorax sp.]
MYTAHGRAPWAGALYRRWQDVEVAPCEQCTSFEGHCSVHCRRTGGRFMALIVEGWLEAGRLYRSTGAINMQLLRPHVYRAWERSHVGGANPRLPRAEALSAVDTERLLEHQGRIILAAQPYLRALSRAAGGERHAAMLGNAGSIVLDVLGDEQSVHGPERVPGPGALLDEGACGANGIGTPLAEGGYVEIVGPEHFIEGFHPFTCQGIPLRDEDSAIAGVLSVSVRRPAVGQRLREILLCAAHAIEMELLAARLEEDMRRVFARQHPVIEPLERLLGDVLQAQASVRLRLEVAADQLAQSQLTHARDLLKLAATVLDHFRHQAVLWQRLALDETAARRPVALDSTLRELVELLEVEAAMGHVEIILHEVEPVVIAANPHALARALFRVILGAIKAARGGVLYVDLFQVPEGGYLCLAPMPGAGVAAGAPEPLQVVFRPSPRPADREQSRKAGFDVHLVKPVDVDTLQRAIEAPAE